MKTFFLSRRSILNLAFFGAATTVKAWLMEFGVVLFAGAVITGSLYLLWVNAQPGAPDQPPRQQEVQQYGPVGGYVIENGVQIAVIGWAIAEMGPHFVVTPLSATADGAGSSDIYNSAASASTATNGFTVYYGLTFDMNQNKTPWVGVAPSPVGSNTPTTLTTSTNSVAVNTSYPTDNSVYLTVSVGGLTWCFFSSDLASGNYTWYFVTNQTAVIERTTNMVHWTPIFTNHIGLNTVESFTDPDPAPPAAAFYRLQYH
jgi:hypothetical protein